MRNATNFTNIIFNPKNPNHIEKNREFNAMPSVAVTEKGRIYVAIETGGFCEPHPDQYITVKYSDDKGNTWSDELLHIETHKEKYIFVADPCLWIDPMGKLHLFWEQEDARPDKRGGQLHSFLPSEIEPAFEVILIEGWAFGDDKLGTTWDIVCDNPDSDKPKFENPHYCFDQGMINKPLVTKTGRWLCPKYRVDDYIHFDYSDDNGKTFKTIQETSPKGFVDCEPCLYEKADGTIVCIWRAREFLHKCYSYDNGEHWTMIEKTDIITPFVKPAVIKLDNGHIVLCCNDDPYVRKNLCLYLSEDEGETWKKKIIDSRFSACYPDLEYRNGNIYVVYDYNRFTDREICMQIVKEEDIINDNQVEIISVSKPTCPVSPLFDALMEAYSKR